MRRAPRSLEEWLYSKLLDSESFHRFVGKIYRKVNNIKEPSSEWQSTFKPTSRQKFKAYRILFWDEMRSTLGLPKKSSRFFKE
ncbi:hypothetical protein HG537_0C00540 [Torulaspora globosa]|uniref:Uncharacterized protein n=1 Tax=Torulaspora globosa TaxID=48254 RepID=A0A7H9HRU1_9SACH|nr:hypothetical protein HG537_0C00540 [Torulaspora sp. CBS 2947]